MRPEQQAAWAGLALLVLARQASAAYENESIHVFPFAVVSDIEHVAW